MFRLMADLAMDRHGELWPDPLVHPDQFVLCRMPGDMDEGVVGGDDLHPLPDQQVLHSADRPLVAGDLA